MTGTERNAFVIGAVVAILVMIGAMALSDSSYYSIVNNARDECEKNLPRTQHCKIIAVP